MGIGDDVNQGSFIGWCWTRKFRMLAYFQLSLHLFKQVVTGGCMMTGLERG